MSKIKQIRKKQQQISTVTSSNELTNLIKIVVIVCAVLLVFYIVTVIVKGKNESESTPKSTVATIQYSKILVGEILNRSESEYYVLVEAEDDQYNDLYNYYLSLYSEKKDALKYYTVDLSDVFNANSIGDTTITKGAVSSFRFSTTTLLKVKKGAVVETYDSNDSIISYFDQLIK